MSLSEIVAKNIKNKRKENGLTQTQLAEILGVAQRTVSLWEQHGDISISNLEKLAYFLISDSYWFLLDHEASDKKQNEMNKPQQFTIDAETMYKIDFAYKYAVSMQKDRLTNNNSV